jgi:carbon-monoxide dehydrogenase small subunit
MVLTAKALLDDAPTADEESLKKAMRGNLCRCTGYRAILDALMDVIRSTGLSGAGS